MGRLLLMGTRARKSLMVHPGHALLIALVALAGVVGCSPSDDDVQVEVQRFSQEAAERRLETCEIDMGLSIDARYLPSDPDKPTEEEVGAWCECWIHELDRTLPDSAFEDARALEGDAVGTDGELLGIPVPGCGEELIPPGWEG